MIETPLAASLVRLFLAFQLKLAKRFHDGVVERIEQPGRLEVVDPGQVAPRPEAEMGQELLRRRIE